MEKLYHNSANKSGVYKIFNKINDRIYIGSAKQFKDRIRDHLNSLLKNKHKNKFLQHDFNKCGGENFVFEVLEVIEGAQEKRLKIEQYYIDLYFDNQILCYNLNKNASIPIILSYDQELERRKKISESTKGKVVSEETKKKISQAHIGKVKTEEHRKNIGLASRGRKMSENNKQKLSERMKGNQNTLGRSSWNKGKKLDKQSEITKQKRSESMKENFIKNPDRKQKISVHNSKKYFLINPNGDFVDIFNLRLFCQENNLAERNMRKVISGERKSHKGWTLPS